jgi:hypothetical protein
MINAACFVSYYSICINKLEITYYILIYVCTEFSLPCVTSNMIKIIRCSLLDRNVLKQKLLIFLKYTFVLNKNPSLKDTNTSLSFEAYMKCVVD